MENDIQAKNTLSIKSGKECTVNMKQKLKASPAIKELPKKIKTFPKNFKGYSKNDWRGCYQEYGCRVV